MTPFTRIGSFAYVGGYSKVTADVPPYMLVDGGPATARGVNVIGLRRSGMAAADRRLVQEAYRLLYRSGLAPARAVEAIRAHPPGHPGPDPPGRIHRREPPRHLRAGPARSPGCPSRARASGYV